MQGPAVWEELGDGQTDRRTDRRHELYSAIFPASVQDFFAYASVKKSKGRFCYQSPPLRSGLDKLVSNKAKDDAVAVLSSVKGK